jgi:hypothetical protein
MEMNTNAFAVLARIETDVASLRKLLGQKTAPPKNVKIPVLQERYTATAAGIAKEQIETAFLAGLISYDKKRGMKRSVTVATVGWSPV